MLESGRIEIFEEGLFSPTDLVTGKRTGDMHPLAIGTEISVIDSSQTVQVDNDKKLVVRVQKSGNGLEITHWHNTLVTQSDSLLARPPYEEHAITSDSFGELPGGRVMEEYGQPEPAVLVTYLGHPLRDVFEPHMGQKTDDASPFAEDLEFQTSHGPAKMLFVGEPVYANVHGLNDGTSGTPFSGQTDQESFGSKLLIGAYVVDDQRFRMPQIEVFAAITPDIDEITRVQSQLGVVSIKPSSEKNSWHASRVIDELTAVSVFSQVVGDPALSELRENFPLPAINYWKKELGVRSGNGALDGWYSELRREHGFNWLQMRADLPQDAVNEERARLIRKLGVEYVEGPPPKISKRKGAGGMFA